MPRPLQRMPLELGLDLDINQLLSDGFIQPGQTTRLKDCYWLDADGDVKANAQIAAEMTTAFGTMRITAVWIKQIVRLVACPRHFGGRQWYFVCPRQGQHVSVLWSPPGHRFFAGRKSWGNGVAYLSQYYGPGSRAHYMAIKLCDHIGGPGASEEWDVPPKPKWMRWRTYERLSERCEIYRQRAALLPREYRLYGDVV